MPAKLTQEIFIAKAKLIHKDKYDYSHSVYKTIWESDFNKQLRLSSDSALSDPPPNVSKSTNI